jgi:hypothetical protein
MAHAAGRDRAASERPVLFGERTMKTVLFAACLTLVAAQAQAISRYDPSRMSCGTVRATIAREGAVHPALSVDAHAGAAALRPLCAEPEFLQHGRGQGTRFGAERRYQLLHRLQVQARGNRPAFPPAHLSGLGLRDLRRGVLRFRSHPRSRMKPAPGAADRRARLPSPASSPWWSSRPALKNRRSCRRRQECGGKG